MALDVSGLEADAVSFENSGFVARGFVDNPNDFESSIFGKSTTRVLADRDKAQGGRWDNIR